MADNRNIFEEVSTNSKADNAPKGGLIDGGRTKARKAIRVWLLMLGLLVAAMIIVGGMTRLTDSGLSITEWKPITGAIPPLSAEVWQQEFDKYKQIPEYQLQNKGMSLEEFKSIFWWEWGHRFLGRFVGLVWAIGFFGFLFTKRIPAGYTGRLLTLGALGGLQGAIGWWMVASGLTGRMVDVASYRLATHLGLAFVIIALISWYYMRLGCEERALIQARRNKERRLYRLSRILLVVVFAQILLGALVAGIDAGRGYIDWPLMNGQFLPSESFEYTPFWSNFFENPALVQFNHRMTGYIAFALVIYAWILSRRSALRASKSIFSWIAAMALLQMTLGVATVLYAAPWQVAIVHQIGAIALMIFILKARFVTLFPAQQSLR